MMTMDQLDEESVMTDLSDPELYDKPDPIKIQIFIKYEADKWALTAGVKQVLCPLFTI